MPRCLPVLVALFCSATLAEEAAGQTHGQPALVRTRAAVSVIESGVVGLVTDKSGVGVRGASILAMGTTVAMARTDDQGRFHLELTPGPYVLRATRDGYISTYRESVQVRDDVPLTRFITLLRVDGDAGNVVLASMTRQADDHRPEEPGVQRPVQAGPQAPVTVVPSDTAWRLRHLPRTALRDETFAPWRTDAPRQAPVDDFLLADFSGRVEFLTTSALAASGDRPTGDWPRGVAYVVLGAPVGTYGDWNVRASLAGGEASAWTLAGEYASRTDRRHTFRAGVAYSEQTLSDPAMRHSLAAIDTVRRVGGVHLSDQWSLPGGLGVDSTLRVERYEYLAEPTLISSSLGLRQQVLPRVAIVASVSPYMVAPGAEQFAPPVSTGVWLPPERTFSPFERHGALRPQEVQAYDIGADAVLGRVAGGEEAMVVRLRRFREASSNQMATLFGLDDASQVGHYYVASPGAVAIDGWLVGIGGQLTRHLEATVDYAVASAEWRPGRAPIGAHGSIVRSGIEEVHDLTATVDAVVPPTSTHVNVALRVSSAFSHPDVMAPGLGARFAIEVRQQLPGRFLGHGEFNLLMSARTLLRQLDTEAGFYDELLTLAPPVRLTCGLQMRF